MFKTYMHGKYTQVIEVNDFTITVDPVDEDTIRVTVYKGPDLDKISTELYGRG